MTDPYEQVLIRFDALHARAMESGLRDADAMTVSTLGVDGRPASREAFERRIARVQARFAGQDVPRPPHGSGYRVVPERIEFWRGFEHRLHERTVDRSDAGRWRRGRLFP